MAKAISDQSVIDDVARVTGDIAPAGNGEFARLRGLLAALPQVAKVPVPDRLSTLRIDEATREAVRGIRLDWADLRSPPLHARRHDPRDDLLAARLAGPLTALGGAERLGPFVVGDRPVFFDFWRAARRFEVTETGVAAPAFVLTSARRPNFSRPGPLTLDLQRGTVWIRGELAGAALPAGAYVGVTVSNGKLRLPSVVSAGADKVEIAAPITAELELVLTAEEVEPAEGGCTAEAKLKLPVLTLKFGPGGLTVEGTEGAATAWGQKYTYREPSGSLLFVPQLWTLLVGYEVAPETFDGSAIASTLADFEDTAAVSSAALALPVVVAQPAALGPAAVSPGFWMALEGLKARWYAPEARYHTLDPWMAIGARGVRLLDVDVAPLSAPVGTDYRLWNLLDTNAKRVPWRHEYGQPFLFHHVCDIVTGEALMATGRARVALDRPVQANGRPVPTPTGAGVVLLRNDGSGPRATLGAVVGDSGDTELVLRNALVWATRAAAVVADGTLRDRQFLDDGRLMAWFGVYAWTPTLPDPYVGNFHICKPGFDEPRALLAASVRWPRPGEPRVSFAGDLGLPIVCENPASKGTPVPAPRSDGNPDVGQTQTEQGALFPDKKGQAEIDRARAKDLREREARVAKANRLNEALQGAIDGQLAERLGRTPPVLLLDVSTNQDLLGVALWGVSGRAGGSATASTDIAPGQGGFPVADLDVTSRVDALRLVTLPQVQWEPVRTLDEDQDVLTLGWFPTPLASATDGGATVLGARSQKLAPVIPEPLLARTKQVFDEGTNVTFRTTLPFGLVTVVSVNPNDSAGRKADLYELTRPDFPAEAARGGLQVTAKAEGGRDDEGGISPYFQGATRQIINGVDLASGAPLGLSVLSSTGDPAGDVETIFNNDMAGNPKVPVTRFDLSGYGGSNFSTWQNPFALFAETSKTQFQVTVGRTALEIIKVASVLHPWGIKVTRSVIVERRSGGGVIRRDTGWQATSPGLFDYRYSDTGVSPPVGAVADYAFDAGVFKGLFDIRSIRPAPGVEFSADGATFVPYYFDADLALDGLSGRVPANGVLGWLQTAPNGQPASKAALIALIAAQGAPGGPIDAWIGFGTSGLPFRARRIEVDTADDGGSPIFVATVRGVPKLPKTGAWSVVQRPVAGVPAGGGEAVPVLETKGVPVIRRYPVKYEAGDPAGYAEPPLDPGGGGVGDWRMADPADLLTPASPATDYCLLQSAPTHAFLFPRPYATGSGPARVRSTMSPELADIIARATSKGAFPPPENAIGLSAPMHFNVGPGGSLALSAPVTVVNHPTPLRLAGEAGHGSELSYEDATLHLELAADTWSAEFTGLTMWSDIAGLNRASGARLRIVGSTDQRPQVAEIDTLVYEPVEKILSYIPVFGAREKLGPIDLGATNAKHEIKLEIARIQEVPRTGFSIGGAEIKLLLGTSGSTGFDLASGELKAAGELTAGVKAEFPILSGGAASVYIIIQLDVKFSIASVVGVVTEEKLELIAFAGIGVKGEIGPFKAYAYLGIGFVFIYDFYNNNPKFGGLVRFEAGVDLKVVKVKLLAELKGVVYKETKDLPPPETGTSEKTYCDYSGKVKLQVDIFLIISISATYTVSDTKALE